MWPQFLVNRVSILERVYCTLCVYLLPRLYSVEAIFLLLLYVYSLMEDSDDVEQLQEEHKLQVSGNRQGI